jgi:(2Fe-2S) ferredoxin
MEIGQKVFDLHLFVCTNAREKPKTGCVDFGAMDLHAALKQELKARKLNKKIRVNKAGCLDMCNYGPVIVLYPEGKWFYNVKVENIPEILDEIVSKAT